MDNQWYVAFWDRRDGVWLPVPDPDGEESDPVWQTESEAEAKCEALQAEDPEGKYTVFTSGQIICHNI